MYMNKKIYKAICPIIALFFFFATISPAAAQAQLHEKKEDAGSLTMLKCALAGKNGQVRLSDDARLAIKEKLLIKVENLFNKIDQTVVSEETIKKYSSILPQNFTENMLRVSAIAKADIPTEEKVTALVDAFGYSCDEIVYVALIVYILEYFGVVYLGYLGNLLFALAALCYFGLI